MRRGGGCREGVLYEEGGGRRCCGGGAVDAVVQRCLVGVSDARSEIRTCGESGTNRFASERRDNARWRRKKRNK